jgi:hypothetical protein
MVFQRFDENCNSIMRVNIFFGGGGGLHWWCRRRRRRCWTETVAVCRPVGGRAIEEERWCKILGRTSLGKDVLKGIVVVLWLGKEVMKNFKAHVITRRREQCCSGRNACWKHSVSTRLQTYKGNVLRWTLSLVAVITVTYIRFCNPTQSANKNVLNARRSEF